VSSVVLSSVRVVVVVVVFVSCTLQEDCARILLFRGADRSIKNYANQTAAEVAIIADSVHIADLINNFKTSDVGKPAVVLMSDLLWYFLPVF